jgi:serine/threonine protein kinase, bacterial
MRLVRVAARHPAEPVRERRAGLVVSGFAHPDIVTTQRGSGCGWPRVCAGPSASTDPPVHALACTILPMPLVSGATAADFHVVRLLGRGQIGELYLVEHPRLPRQYALKILSADVSTDPEYRFRFSQESARAAALWHPNLVSLYDRGEFEDRLWLSMDYVDGTDAAQLLTDTYPDGMPADMVIEIVSAIADALDYAHEQGLVHGYVNPSNILLTNSESARRRILLTGFGISRRADEINSLTRANLGIGTVSYAAPEQLIDDSIDGRADQYALAGTAFHLLTGWPPFQHMNPTVVISKSLNEPAPRPSDVKPELVHFEAPFARALMKAPNERFELCRDFATALEARCSLKLSTRNAGAAALVTVPKTDNGAPTEPPLPPLPARAAAVAPPPAAAVAPPRAATVAPPRAATVAPRRAATAPAPAAAEVGEAVAPPDVLPETDVDDADTFAENDAWSAATDDSSTASRRRRRLHTAGLGVTIMAVAVGGLLGVMALLSGSKPDDTSPNIETSSSVTKVPPPRTSPATAIPPPMVTAPAPVITTPPKPTPSLAATTAPPTTSYAPRSTTVATTAPPTTWSAPPSTTVATTTKPHSPSPTTSTTPAGVDTRPAVGMPCGPEGTTATSNSGGPVVCLNTPGGSAWEPPGG